jgi:precorrin-6B methylase 2
MILTKIKNRLHYYLIQKNIIEYLQIDGWLTKSEALGLYTIASQLPKDAVIVEIGTWKGKSTYCMAKGLKSGRIYSVDPFDASGEKESAVVYEERKGTTSLLEQFEIRMKELKVFDRITPMKGLSNQFVGKIKSIDFLFIDGDHSIEGCDFDFTNYAPYLNKNGYLAFHDYYEDRNELGPTWVVKNKVLKSTDYKFINLYDSLWIAQKIN